MGRCITRGGDAKRQSPQVSQKLAATLCMLVVATCLAMVSGKPLRPRPTRSSESSAKYEDYDASDEEEQPYSFQYEVDAPYHGTWHDRREVKSGKETEGRFRVALPDHRLQTVTYKATHARGFQADVQFEQHPDFNALRGNIGKAPVIGTPVVPSTSHSQSEEHVPAKPQSPAYGYQIAVGNDYGKRRRRPSKASSLERPSSDTKFSSRPVSRRPSSSSSHRKHTSRPSSAAYERPSVEERPSVVYKRPISVYERPSIDYERPSLEEPSSFSHHSSGSLSAFVSISPDILKPTTSRPLRVSRPKAVTRAPFAGYLPSPPSGNDKKAVPSRPLRTRQRTTLKPIRKPHSETSSSYGDRPPSFGDKQLSRPRPLVGSQPLKPDSEDPKDVPIPQGESVPHLPDKEEPNKKGMEPPATTDESFSVAGKPERYSIRKEGMSSIRSRLNSIVHDK